MQLKHLKSLLPHQDGAAKVSAVAWAPNNLKLAVCTWDRIVVLFDETGEKKDKFSTKPADPKYSKKSYMVRGLAFSPDSSKLAVGQTDNIIYVYRIGEGWNEKKVICNKFLQSSAVTCLAWPLEGPIVYGLADGKVREANVKTGKSKTLYGSDSYVCSLTTSPNGKGILSGHADGSVVRYYVAEDENPYPQGKVVSVPVPPYGLAWTSNHVLIAGCDKRVLFYTPEGKLSQTFDYTKDDSEKEFTTAVASPSGQTVVIGSYDRLRVYAYSPGKGTWEEAKSKEIPNLYTITSLAWKRDGSRIACGTLCGGVEMFNTVLKRSVWKNKWEMTYVGPSQVLIKPLQGGGRGVSLKSKYGYEIQDVKIMGREQFLMARTPDTLLLGDLGKNLLSEVVWTNTGGNEKFYFDNDNVAMIFNAGELSLVEYGTNEILVTVRTEFMNPHLISVRINERKHRGVEENKKMAYLLDLKTIRILDLTDGMTLGEVTHDAKIDWLELNETGRKLLFRDRRLHLNLLDLDTQQKFPILNYCGFVSWVPGSDVVVAQNRGNLCIWYNIDTPERMSMIPVKGEVVEIERNDGKTEVVVAEGNHQTSYQLDEGLIEFGTAIDDGDLSRAVAFLETLEMTPEAEAMWRTLAKISLETRQLDYAERCYSALGDVAKARYLREMNEIAERASQTMGGEGTDYYEVRARMAILENQFPIAEAIYLEQNQLDHAIQMYQQLHRWEDALKLAETRGHPDLEHLRSSYIKWLLESGQEEKAGALLETEGDYMGAINMYLKGGLPTRAARLASSVPELKSDLELIQKIANGLLKGEFHDKAGDLYREVNDERKAMECYRKGGAYAKAVELARDSFPAEVVSLEEEWGDHLMVEKQMDAAINHYIEAGQTMKALDASVAARQWKRAAQIIQVVDDPASLGKYCQKLAQHYASVGDYQTAEKFYVDAGMYKDAIEMYNQTGQWERAHQLASQHLKREEVAEMYIRQAQVLEEQGKFRDAERLYIAVSEPDLAITMYKNHRMYDQMMKLVTQYHPDLVSSTHMHLAKEMEAEGSYQQAEQYYVKAEDWKSAVSMYRGAEMWEDAYRVAKNHGGPQAGKQVAFIWAKSLGGDSAVKLLNKFNLLEQCIDYACENYMFDFAFDLAKTAMKQKTPDIHYKYAMALEDDGKFREAEEEFIKAGKAKEAVLMYVHNQDWEAAQRVAESHDPDSVNDVLTGQAKVMFQARDFPRFESLLLRAQRPEIAIKLYKEAGMWNEALRLCKEYLPHKLQTLQDEYDRSVMTRDGQDPKTLLAQASEWEQAGEYNRAIDCYLRVSPEMSQDPKVAEKAWSKAGDIALKFLEEEKGLELAKSVANRLHQNGYFNAAAQLYLAVDMIREAIESLISGEEWSKAKKVAQELDPRFETYVDSKYKEFLKTAGKTDQLASVDLIGALDMYAQQGNWQKCIDTAKQHGPQVLHKYLALYATQLIKDRQPVEAMNLYVKHGAPANEQNLNIYKKIATDIFGLRNLRTSQAYDTWAHLRGMLLNIWKALPTPGGMKEEFEKLLLVAHYYSNRSAFLSKKSMETMAAKLSISLLRHSDVVPADKAFYEAGTDAKKVGWDSMAFVFLNRYLDLYDAIEEGSTDLLDHSDFVDTDIPFEVPLPEAPHLTEAEHEEIKEWVLAISMDQKIGQSLPLDERMTYEASLVSKNNPPAQPCLVTGYPVLRTRVEFQQGSRVANKEDWNKLLMEAKMTQSNDCQDVINFITQWAGGTSNPGYSFQ